MAPGPADLPDPVVGLAPAGLEEVHQRSCSSHAGFVGGLDGPLRRLVERGHDLAVDVELELAGSRVADPHRCGLLVAGQPVDLPLVQPPLAGRAVHDLHLGRVAGRWPRSSQSRQAIASW